MRVWDIQVEKLCRNHLLGEHNEIHAIFSIITKNKSGYSNHPEVIRWKGKLKALCNRHDEVAHEMLKRGYKHKSPLNTKQVKGKEIQDQYVNTIEEQIKILNEKDCKCRI